MTGDPGRRPSVQARRRGGPPGSQCLSKTVTASVPAGLLHPGPPSPAGFMWLCHRCLGSTATQHRVHPGSCSCALDWNAACSFQAVAAGSQAGEGTPAPGLWCPTVPRSSPLLLRGGACSWRERLLPSDTISTSGLGGNVELFLWLMIS